MPIFVNHWTRDFNFCDVYDKIMKTPDNMELHVMHPTSDEAYWEFTNSWSNIAKIFYCSLIISAISTHKINIENNVYRPPDSNKSSLISNGQKNQRIIEEWSIFYHTHSVDDCNGTFLWEIIVTICCIRTLTTWSEIWS